MSENDLAEDIPPEVKAALVMLTLGEGIASELFKKFGKDEIKILNKGMMNLTMLTPEDEERVLLDYFDLLQKGDPLRLEGGEFYFKSLLEKSMGNEGRRLAGLRPLPASTQNRQHRHRQQTDDRHHHQQLW